MSPEILAIGPAASVATVLVKLGIFAAELSCVEEEIIVYRDVLTHHKRTVISVRSQLAAAEQYLPESEVAKICQDLQDSDRVLTSIRILIDKPLRKMEQDGKMSVKQKFRWVLQDTLEAKALDKFIATCHSTMVGNDMKLAIQLQFSGRSPAPAIQTPIPTPTTVEDDR